MRLGQILVEAALISPEQLAAGLEYGAAKGIFLGRALKLLKSLRDEDLERALQAQKFIKLGFSPVLAIKALQMAVHEEISLEQGIRERSDSYVCGHEAHVLQIDANASAEVLLKEGDKSLLEDECANAEAYYQAAKNILKATGEKCAELAPVCVRMGNTYLAINSFDKAEESYKEALDITLSALPPDSLQSAHALESLGDLYALRGSEAAANETYTKALDVIEKHLPSQLSYYAAMLRKLVKCSQVGTSEPTRPQPIGEMLKAAGLISEEQLKGALRMARQSQTPVGVALRENLMIDDRELQSALKAQFCIRHGLLSEQLAIDWLSRAARRRVSLERILHESGVLATNQEKFDIYREIAQELDRLVDCESSSVSTQNEVAPTVFRLGTLYDRIGDHSQAEVYYSRALKKWEGEIKEDLNIARTCVSLAKINRSQNKHEEVLVLMTKALEHRERALGNAHEETIETLEDLAEYEIEYKDAKSAITHLLTAIASREELGQESCKFLRAQILLGDGFCMNRIYDEAKTTYEKALRVQQTVYGPASFACAGIVEKLGDLYAEQELFKSAIAQYNYALIMLQGIGKGESPSVKELQEKISRFALQTN